MTTVFRDLGQTRVGAIMHWISVCPNMQTCLQTSSDVVWWLISIVTTAISVPVNQYCDVESPSLVGPGSSMPVETIRLCWHANRLDWHGSRLGWHAGGADLCIRVSGDDPSLLACQSTRLVYTSRIWWSVLAVPCQWGRPVSAGMPVDPTSARLACQWSRLVYTCQWGRPVSAGMPVEPTCVHVTDLVVSPGSPMPVETIRLYRHASRPDFGSAGMPTEPICVYVTAL